MLQTFATYF